MSVTPIVTQIAILRERAASRDTKDKIHKKLWGVKQHMVCLIFVYSINTHTYTHTHVQQITHLMFWKTPMPLTM